MFKNWAASDWIGFIAVCVPMLAAALGALWLTAKRIGSFESEHGQMKADIAQLGTATQKVGALDTAVQLITQSMTTMQSAFVDFREQIKDDRREDRAVLDEIRKDVKGMLTKGRASNSRAQ